MADEAQVTLTSADGEAFRIPKRIAVMSDIIKSMLEEGDTDDIPLTDIKAPILAKVIDFMKHHADVRLPEIEKPLKSANLSEIVPAWDANFVELEQEVLFELVLAANYLEIKSLLDLSCAKVASMVKGKSPEEIRRTFNIKNDFTPEEEQQVIEENKWISEA